MRDILDGMSNTILMAERELGQSTNPRDVIGCGHSVNRVGRR
ncbi:MAG: DUF1559 domain-containing protein [Planctomycetaceae bacterium]